MESTVAAGRESLRGGLWVAGLLSLALLLVYHETVWSMVLIWSRSDTFAHGFLILPISLWLIWTRRDQMASARPLPALWVSLLVAPLSVVWVLAWLVDVAVIQQLAFVAIMITGVWAILGHRLTGMLAFPLFFLFFAVPMGEGLIHPMMEFTASSTVWMIEMTGIPVYREGLNFALPSGRWSVVEACSGVRYIIASVTVGALYAYLTYRSWTRRSLFVLVSAIVPIFANSVRAYIIVMLGHFSDMKVATGADHLIYGWVFFGLVIFLLFWLGAFFREDHLDSVAVYSGTTAPQYEPIASSRMLLLTALCTLLIASIAPLMVYTALARSARETPTLISLPEVQGSWRQSMISSWSWRPPATVTREQSAYYEKDGEVLGLFVQFADGTNPDADVVGSGALFSLEDSDDEIVRRNLVSVRVLGNELLVNEAQVRSVDEEFLVWSWYLMGDVSTSNDYVAKFQEVGARLGYGERGAYRIVIATHVLGSSDETRARLQVFLDDYAQVLYENLRNKSVMDQ